MVLRIPEICGIRIACHRSIEVLFQYETDEQLDYPRIMKMFEEVGDKAADEIVQHLSEAGKRWRNSRQ